MVPIVLNVVLKQMNSEVIFFLKLDFVCTCQLYYLSLIKCLVTCALVNLIVTGECD